MHEKLQKQPPRGVLRKRCPENTQQIYRRTPMPEACNFIKKETVTLVFSCEFCKISKNTFSHRTPLVVASEDFFAIVLKNLSIPQHEDPSVNKDHIEDPILKSIEKCIFKKSMKLVQGGVLKKRTTLSFTEITHSDIKKE